MEANFVASAIHEDGVVAGRFALDRGFNDHLGLRVEGYYGHEDAVDDGVGAARAGLRYAPIPHLELHAGGGVGSVEGGGFAGGDAGIVLGYQNPYFVPYIGFRGGVAAPLSDARVVKEGVSFRRQTTLEHLTELGFAVPFNPNRLSEVAMHMSVGLGGSVIFDRDTEARSSSGRSFTLVEDTVNFQFTWGLRYRFGNLEARRANAD